MTTPNAAAAESRFVIAACTGISSDLNAISRSKKLRPITVRMTSGNFAVISVARSTLLAVLPPTSACIPGLRAGGITSFRS